MALIIPADSVDRDLTDKIYNSHDWVYRGFDGPATDRGLPVWAEGKVITTLFDEDWSPVDLLAGLYQFTEAYPGEAEISFSHLLALRINWVTFCSKQSYLVFRFSLGRA